MKSQTTNQVSFDENATVEIEFVAHEWRSVVALPHWAIDKLASKALAADAFNFAEALNYLGVKKYRLTPEEKFWRIFDQQQKYTNAPFSDEHFDTALVVGVINGGEVGLSLFNAFIAPENTRRMRLEKQSGELTAA